MTLEPSSGDEDLVPVHPVPDEATATMLHDFLEAQGIHTAVVSAQIPWLGTIESVRRGYWGQIEVMEHDAARAKRADRRLPGRAAGAVRVGTDQGPGGEALIPPSATANAAPRFTRDALAERVGSFRGRRILVLGDAILDRYLWGRATRVSPEAPVLVVDIDKEELRLGGAANVAHNVRALGATPVLIAAMGDDGAANDLTALLEARGVDSTPGLVRDGSRRTTVKTRIIAHNQQVLRADEESREPLPAAARVALWERTQAALEGADAVLISDYGKGVVTPELLERLLPELARRGIPSAVDPKEEHFARYRGVSVITPNALEAAEAWGKRFRSEADLIEAGFGLRERLGVASVLITRGESGMSLFTDQGHTHFPTRARKVFDVTGAGDTVVATIATALAARASLPEACVLANHAAGLVVAELGTAAASAADLIASLGDLPRG